MTIAPRLIGRDAKVTLALGGSVLGTPTYITPAIDLTPVLKTCTESTDSQDVDVTAISDTVEQKRVKRISTTIETECLVGAAGSILTDAAVGQYIQMTFAPLSTMATPYQYDGVVTKHSIQIQDDAQTEKFTVFVGAN